jgi:hypothetical protein
VLKVVFILLIVTAIAVVLLTHPYSGFVKSPTTDPDANSPPAGEEASRQPVLLAGTAGVENGGWAAVLAKAYVEPILLSAGTAGKEIGGTAAIVAKGSVQTVLLSAGTAGAQVGGVAQVPTGARPASASPTPRRPSNTIPANCRERVNTPAGGWYFRNKCR